MKKVTAMLILFLGLAGTALAQSDPLETGWHVSVNGAFSNLSGQQTNNGYLSFAEVRVAKHWSARLNYFATADPTAKIITAGPEYNFSLRHILPKSDFLDVSKLEAFAGVSLGASHLEPCPNLTGQALADCKVLKESPAPGFKFAAVVGGGVNYRITDKLTIRPLEVNYVRSAAGGQLIGNHLQFASGVGLRF